MLQKLNDFNCKIKNELNKINKKNICLQKQKIALDKYFLKANRELFERLQIQNKLSTYFSQVQNSENNSLEQKNQKILLDEKLIDDKWKFRKRFQTIFMKIREKLVQQETQSDIENNLQIETNSIKSSKIKQVDVILIRIIWISKNCIF